MASDGLQSLPSSEATQKEAMALLEVECRNLITGLKLSDARCVELHAELDQLHSQLDVAQSQLDVTQSQSGQLHSQLDEAQSELGRERMQSAEQLTEQRQQSAELRIGLESAQRALEAATAERGCLERRQSEEEVR
jgi:chromosome segregation ATPase